MKITRTLMSGSDKLQQDQIDYIFNSFNVHIAYYEFIQTHLDQLNVICFHSMPLLIPINNENFYINNPTLASLFKTFLDKNKASNINIHSSYCEEILR